VEVKPDVNSVEVDPQLSHNGHPVHGALVGAVTLWPENRCEILTEWCECHSSVTWSTAGFLLTATRFRY